jgi:hypothetical protein
MGQSQVKDISIDMQGKNNAAPGLLFETSWEVCNKIGGIYTVLATKAPELLHKYGNNLIFVGPDVWSDDNPASDFTERKTLLKNCMSKVSLPYGISIRTGRWNIPGSPIAVLVKFDGVYSHLNEIYGEMWNKYGVDSLHAYGDYAEGCAFAIASACVIEAIGKHLKGDNSNTVALFNEWTTAMGLLYLQQIAPGIATIFTTHATSIGRSICGNGKPLYDYFYGYNGEQMARELNMESKHSLETAAARYADCFTTVSSVTGKEATQLLGVKPDIITPNGFNLTSVPKARSLTLDRKKGRERILKIASLLYGEKFDDANTLIVATSGRQEYRNKGIDLYLDSVAEASRLPELKKNILALVLVPGWVSKPLSTLQLALENRDNEVVIGGCATHQLHEENDIIRRIGDLSRSTDGSKVRYLYLPCYLNGEDGILDISYYKFLPAIDVTVFPSYYEPWGYTPLESVAYSVPTITTDKSGFGQWVLSSFENGILNCGVDVVARTDSNYADSCKRIAKVLADYSGADATAVQMAEKRASDTAAKASWSLFIDEYYKAFAIAEDKRDKRLRNNKKKSY